MTSIQLANDSINVMCIRACNNSGVSF